MSHLLFVVFATTLITLIGAQGFSISVPLKGFKNATSDILLDYGATLDDEGCVVLTSSHSKGLVYANMSGTLSDISFSTYFVFQMLSFGTSSGEGIAFFLTPAHNHLAETFADECLGLINNCAENLTSPLFAVEFDSYPNSDLQDPSCDHIGVDLNSLVSEKTLCLVGSYANLSFQSNSTLSAWIDYKNATKLLSVRLANSSQKPSDPIFTYTFDLASMLGNYTVIEMGISASTGLDKAEHRICAWDFSLPGISQLTANSLPPSPSPSPSPYSSPSPSISPSSSPPFISPSPVPHGNSCTRWHCKEVLASIFSVIALAIIIALIVHHSNPPHPPPLPPPQSQPRPPSPQQISYEVLCQATNNFDEQLVLGRGAFGHVYKGTMQDGSIVAVKALKEYSNQGPFEFLAELSSIGQITHKYLIKLRGWCLYNRVIYIVYEYMSNGSLDKLLFSNTGLLPWKCRFEILKGVAEALAYVHGKGIVHRDVKAANVLLDHNLIPRLGDFGLAKAIRSGEDQQHMSFVGTAGYIAPEIKSNGLATLKSDVYSFGILLLEMACGRAVLANGKSLLDLLWDHVEAGRRILDSVDPHLNGLFDPQEILCVLHLGLICCHLDQDHRPCMIDCCNILANCRVRELPESRPLPPPQNSDHQEATT